MISSFSPCIELRSPRQLRLSSVMFRFYSPSQISEAEKRIGFSRKKGSTTAELKAAERSIGKAYVGKRVNQPGLYSQTDKWTLLFAISGDPAARRWRDIWT